MCTKKKSGVWTDNMYIRIVVIIQLFFKFIYERTREMCVNVENFPYRYIYYIASLTSESGTTESKWSFETLLWLCIAYIRKLTGKQSFDEKRNR